MKTLSKDVGIYHDSDTSRWHFDCLSENFYQFNQDNYYLTSNQIDNFCQSKFLLKLAGFHVSFPAEATWLERLLKVRPFVDHVFVFCSELHESTVAQLKQIDLPNVSIFVCGFIDYVFKQARVYRWMDWFVTTSYFYKHYQPDLLKDKLIETNFKKYYFDVLLGCERIHRNFVYNYIVGNKLESKVFMTYHKRADQDLLLSNTFVFENENCSFDNKIYKHTSDTVEYYGSVMCLSQIVPLSIYNQTLYTLVTETNANNNFNFYTEKIVKPIISKRLFVAVAGKNYLKNLRSLGFKTFDGIIDESYDSVDNNEVRWNMACEQLLYLIKADPNEIFHRAQPIIEHNVSHMFNFDWYFDFSSELAGSIAEVLANVEIIVN